MTDFKIEFEWERESYDNTEKFGRPKYPNEKQATELYHIVEEAMNNACHDRGIDLPSVAWMVTSETCDKCHHKHNSGVIQ
jgi:hypothetical protein